MHLSPKNSKTRKLCRLTAPWNIKQFPKLLPKVACMFCPCQVLGSFLTEYRSLKKPVLMWHHLLPRTLSLSPGFAFPQLRSASSTVHETEMATHFYAATQTSPGTSQSPACQYEHEKNPCNVNLPTSFAIQRIRHPSRAPFLRNPKLTQVVPMSQHLDPAPSAVALAALAVEPWRGKLVPHLPWGHCGWAGDHDDHPGKSLV